MIVGVDPGGKSGGIAVLGDHRIELHRMPDLRGIVAFMRGLENGAHVFIEKAQAAPGNGVVGMFNYGVHFGSLLGVLSAFHIRHTLVPSPTWTRQLHQGTRAGKPKQRSLEAVIRLFPEVDLVPDGCRKPHSGLIDALLIAEYGRRTLGGSAA